VAVTGWILDKSAAVRDQDPLVRRRLAEYATALHIFPIGELEYLYSARSASDYDTLRENIERDLAVVLPPPDIFDRALSLQRELAHHHGLWHRIPIPDLLIAETALFHDMGIVHVDRDYDRIAEVRPLVSRWIG
jgi:predicted nucleic acid-binding protein